MTKDHKQGFIDYLTRTPQLSGNPLILPSAETYTSRAGIAEKALGVDLYNYFKAPTGTTSTQLQARWQKFRNGPAVNKIINSLATDSVPSTAFWNPLEAYFRFANRHV